jgi:hypothetical protein
MSIAKAVARTIVNEALSWEAIENLLLFIRTEETPCIISDTPEHRQFLALCGVGEIKKESVPPFFRTFTKADWNAYCGAKRFEDGSEPLIWESDAITVLVDGVGVLVTVVDEINFHREGFNKISNIRAGVALVKALK